MWRNSTSEGGWRCAVKAGARQNPKNRLYYHRADGGYVRRRTRKLQQQRTNITERLIALEQEARTVAES